MVALDDAMNLLGKLDPRKVQVVEMRFFGGLSVEETAEVLKVSAVNGNARLEYGQGLALPAAYAQDKQMDSERWKQVDSLLQSVLERPPEEREAFLRQACVRRPGAGARSTVSAYRATKGR